MIYLDNAATGFPKPAGVIDEVTRCMRTYCGNAGRGSHAFAMAAAEKIYECRTACARFFGSSYPEGVVFTPNATVAINTVLKGLLGRGDHVLLSDMEHNAVFRPIYRMAEEGRITYDVFPTEPTEGKCSSMRLCTVLSHLIKPNTRMLICAHASNICSAHLPLEVLGGFCRRHGILLVVDAAQSAGHLPIHMERMHIDALCVPGHKGLLGPQGSGCLLLRQGLSLDTLIEGGSGLYSLEGRMPDEPPERYEAGTLATPAIAGLCAGLGELERIGISRIFEKERALNLHLQNQLERIAGVRVYAPLRQGSILLFNCEGITSEELGRALDRRGICVRAGYHCSALGHRTLQTPRGGAVRVSPSFYSDFSEMDLLAEAVEDIRKSRE